MIKDPFEFDTYFYLLKDGDIQIFVLHREDHVNCLVICIKRNVEEDISSKNYENIGIIWDQGVGHLDNTTKLAWKIDDEFRDQGLMSLAFKKYLELAKPDVGGFEAYIKKDNMPSYQFAIKQGFKIFKESPFFYTMVLI